MHYARVRRTGDAGNAEYKYDPEQGCNANSCDREHFCKGLCSYHYWISQKPARREYYQKNKTYINAINKKYYKKNRKRRTELSKLWRIKNLEKVRRYNKNYRDKNLELVRERTRKWQKENPERVSLLQRRYRATKANLPGSFTAEEFERVKAFFDYKCVCCGEITPLEADHIVPISWPNSSDYIQNIQPLCKSCNGRKGNHHDMDYRIGVHA